MEFDQNQDLVLADKNSQGKDRDWRGRKIASIKLSEIFEELHYKETMVERVATCADALRFYRQSDGRLKLYQAYFCKNKLCSMCNWRRSMKYSYQTSRIVDEAMKQYPKGRFLFLTLTVKNVPGSELNGTLSQLTKSFDRLFKRAKIQRNLLGYLRSIEVTYNELTNEYHPHIHVLLFVKSSYFKNADNYLSQEEWGDLWAKSLKVDYIPMVDIRAVKDQGKGLQGAILETAKYPTKPFKLSLENAHVVEDLYNGLYRKRQLGYGGIFKEIKKRLAMDDAENGDLVHTTDDSEDVSNGTKIVAIWSASRQNYFIKM
ncbi:protein rep [Streptococcus ovuberis]|uniref:Protein rep n=1 Tax=Streptococcus ovuberis TaxID=1936207 RepID=A0A7X6S2J1_9STRE|nr:protein rep [Streptococcus ovuberis]NKZ21425.1 protein rep [Streptococcus ovuberis]